MMCVVAPKPDYYHTMHDGQVVTLQRSPFFNDVLLCVGGWSFTIWKEGVSVSRERISNDDVRNIVEC